MLQGHRLYGGSRYIAEAEKDLMRIITFALQFEAFSLTPNWKGGDVDSLFIRYVHCSTVQMNDTRSCIGAARSTNPFCATGLDSAHMLHLASLQNHDDFCLSYTWTYRDFIEGVLGLAWIATKEGEETLLTKRLPFLSHLTISSEFYITVFICRSAVIIVSES